LVKAFLGYGSRKKRKKREGFDYGGEEERSFSGTMEKKREIKP